MQSDRSDLFYMVAGACALAFSPIFVKLASVGPAIAGFYRMAIGGSILLVIALARAEVLWKGWKPFGLTCLGGALFATDLSLWHRSIEYVGPGLATILGNFQVFFLAVMGYFFLKERLSWRFLVALPMAMLGLILIVWGDWGALGDQYKLGVWLGLSTAIMYASFVLTLRKSQAISNPLSPIANITVVSLIVMVIMGIEGLWQGQSFAIPDAATATFLAGYGIFGQVLGWVWVTRGLKSTPASLAGLILLIQPSVAFSWDVLFFGRPTDGLAILGAIMALSAIYLGTRSKNDPVSENN